MSTGLSRLSFATGRQRWFLIALAVLFIALSLQYSIKAMANRSAILRWRQQIHHLGDENIYERYTYPNPPIMAILLAPIAKLPPLVGSLTWFYLKLAMAVFSVLWVFRLVETPEQPFPPWGMGLAVLLSLRPIMGDLSHGNVNLLILFLVVASLFAFHKGYDLVSGCVLALAIACKVTPALFVPYWIWKRQWKVLGGCCMGLVLFFLVVPGFVLGHERNLELLKSWVNQMVTPFVVAGTVTSEHPNQSLPGLMFRLLTHSPSFLDGSGLPDRYDNLLSLDPSKVKWIIKTCMLAFAGIIVWTCRTKMPPRQGWRLVAEYSLVVLGMLLFSERTWKHHCVTLIVPYAVLAYYLTTNRQSRTISGLLVAAITLVMILMSTTSTTLFEDGAAKMAQVYGAYVWACIILAGAVACILITREPAHDRIVGPAVDDRLTSIP